MNQKVLVYFKGFTSRVSNSRPREGVIIEWPLNGLFHDRRDVIITSQMVVIWFPSNNGGYLKCRNFVISLNALSS